MWRDIKNLWSRVGKHGFPALAILLGVSNLATFIWGDRGLLNLVLGLILIAEGIVIIWFRRRLDARRP